MNKHTIYFFNSMTRSAPLYFQNYYLKDNKDDFSLASIDNYRALNVVLSNDYFDWAKEIGLYSVSREKRFRLDNYPALITFCYRQEDIADLLLLTKFLFYFFTHDNIADNGAHDLNEININHTGVLLNHAVDINNPLIKSLSLINEELNAREKDGYNFEYFKKSLIDYYRKTSQLASLRTLSQGISESELMHQRRETGGVPQMFEFGLALRKIHISEVDRANEHLIKACDLANEIIVLSNDIASFDAESAEESVQQNVWSNLLLYKMHVHGFTKDNARSYTVMKINRALNAFEEAVKNIDDHENMRQYTSLMRDWLCGNIEWSKITQRYNLPGIQQRAHEYHGDERTLFFNEQDACDKFTGCEDKASFYTV